jgi:hypothetical protein
LLDALLDAVQVSSDVLLGGSRFAVDFGLKRVHVVVDACELDAKIFAELIDAFAHDGNLLGKGNLWHLQAAYLAERQKAHAH